MRERVRPLHDRGLCRITQQLRKRIAKDKIAVRPLDLIPKKKLARNLIRASSLAFVSYANLIAIVVMIPMVAVNPMPVPVVRGPRGIAIVSIWSVVTVRVIAISVWIAVIVAVPVGWISESHSYAPNSD